jgi:5'-nucleotidase (lipoprotein e(P4) family)
MDRSMREVERPTYHDYHKRGNRMRKIMMNSVIERTALVMAMAASACSSTTTTMRPATPTAAAVAPSVPADIRWARRSAEHRATYLQTFSVAGQKLAELARGLAPQSWAIITDADETILDNSAFEESRAVNNTPYSEELWGTFVRSQVSTALPGAVAFLGTVHALGGRVVVVTNRAEDLCAVTRSNLQKVGLTYDAVLCHPPAPASGDKNPRFRAVQEGTAAPGMPALRVLMWLGDNIEDFPSLKQPIRTMPDSAFAHFGHDYFVLPNPMYGSWEKNPD